MLDVRIVWLMGVWGVRGGGLVPVLSTRKLRLSRVEGQTCGGGGWVGGLGGLGFGPEVWVEGLVVQVPGCNLPRSPGTFASPRKWSEGARPQLPDLLARMHHSANA